MRLRITVCLALFLAGVGRPAAAADSLVLREAGHVKPGLAKSWQQQGNAVVFTLQAGVDGARAAQAIAEHVTGAQAVFEGGVLQVTGLPMVALLDQLATLSVTGDDPLGELGALGNGAVASAANPEGGGSIRASRPTELATGSPGTEGLHMDPHEAFEAEVLEVKRGAFPQVTLRLRVRRAADTGPLAKALHKGRIIEASVIYAGAVQPLDLQSADNRRNLAAFYLAAGDRLVAHGQPSAPGRFDRVGLDWLERH